MLVLNRKIEVGDKALNMITELKNLVILLASKGINDSASISDHIKDYIVELRNEDLHEVNKDALDIVSQMSDIVQGKSQVYLYYGNLYTFVVINNFVPPYYNWISDEVFETTSFKFTRTGATWGSKSVYTMYNKETGKIESMGESK